MNPFFKNSNIFLARKSIFSKKKFQNRTYFTRISEFFEKIFKILIFLEDLYKSREIPHELYYIVETFIKKAQNGLDGGLLEMQRRRQNFFGGLSGHLKAITEGPRTVVKFHF